MLRKGGFSGASNSLNKSDFVKDGVRKVLDFLKKIGGSLK